MSFLKKKSLIYILLVSIISFSRLCFAESDIDFIYYKRLPQVTKSLNILKDNGFSEYLLSASTNSYDEYFIALTSLFKSYRDDFNKLNSCIDDSLKEKEKYDQDWISGLLKIAGREYVINNEKSILNLIYNISTKNDRALCIENEKELTFSEMEYLSVVKEFFTLYIDYIDNLQKEQQENLSDKKTFAKHVIDSLSKPPFQEMRRTGSVRKYLSVTNRVDLEPKVVEFIIQNPTFQGSFDFLRAAEDLRNITSAKKALF